MQTKPDVFDRYALQAALEAIGATFKGNAFHCLWHDDQSPSCGLYSTAEGHWRYKCHGCDAHGDLIDLLAANENLSPADILRKAKEPRRVPRPPVLYGTLDDCIKASASWRQETPNGTHYYRSANGSDILLAVTRMLTGVVDPDTDKPKKTFHQAHHTPDGWIGKKPPGAQPLYYLPEIKANKSIIICEGERKCDALQTIGLTATCSPGGAENAKNADWSPLAGKRIVIWPDHDDAGSRYADDVTRILMELPKRPEALSRIDPKELALPPKGDVIEFLASAQGDQRNAIIAVCKKAVRIDIKTPIDVIMDHIERKCDGAYYLAPWPFPVLSKETCSLLPGNVTMLAGAPGSAKSWFVLQAMLHLLGNGIPSALMAIECKMEWHLDRCLSHLDGKTCYMDVQWIKDNKPAAELAVAKHSHMLGLFGNALTVKPAPTIDDCLKWIEAQCAAGVRVLFIDPITLADSGKEKSWEADKRFMAKARETIEKHGASLVVVTHPPKANGTPFAGSRLDNMAGGVVYSRASDSAMCLTSLPAPEHGLVIASNGLRERVENHKFITITKSRNSSGVGKSIGFRFVGLKFEETGIMIEDDT